MIYGMLDKSFIPFGLSAKLFSKERITYKAFSSTSALQTKRLLGYDNFSIKKPVSKILLAQDSLLFRKDIRASTAFSSTSALKTKRLLEHDNFSNKKPRLVSGEQNTPTLNPSSSHSGGSLGSPSPQQTPTEENSVGSRCSPSPQQTPTADNSPFGGSGGSPSPDVVPSPGMSSNSSCSTLYRYEDDVGYREYLSSLLAETTEEILTAVYDEERLPDLSRLCGDLTYLTEGGEVSTGGGPDLQGS